MKPEKPTASSLMRAHECPASCAIAVRVHSTSAHAERGTELHGFVEAVLGKHKSLDAALADVPAEWRQTAADLAWATLLDGIADRDAIRCEVAYAVDVATFAARELGQSLGRKYPPTSDTEVTGTADIVAVMVDGRPLVADIKTGQPVTPCAENWQMRFQAFAVHALTGAPEVVARLSYVAEDGRVTHDEHAFDAFDLATVPADIASILDRIAAAAVDVEAGKVVVSRGDWCAYCPAFASCPAQVGLVRSLVPDIVELDAATTALAHLTPQQVGVAWSRFKELAPMVKKIDAALKEYVRAHPGEVVLPDGRVIVEIEKGRTSINGERALALAREYGATQEEQASCMRRAEWTELRATRPKLEKPAAKKRAKKSDETQSDDGEAA